MQGKQKRLRRLAAIALLAAAAPATAEPALQSLDAVRTAAREHAARLIGSDAAEVAAAPLDRRLRLAACTTALESFTVGRPDARASRLTVGVRCTRPRPWKLYVPVSVERRVAVVVAARTVPRGRPLSAADLEVVKLPADRAPGRAFAQPDDLLGLMAARTLSPGEAVAPADLARATLVERGRALRLEAGFGGGHVTMAGVALEDGARGEIVAVRNSASGLRVEARVVGRDRVRVGP